MIDFENREKILAEIPELKHCFQCGTCVSSCPAKLYSTDFSPREFILESLHGMQQGVINDHLWKCLTCNRCNERCPQDVNPFEVIIKLKNIAVKEGLMSQEKRQEVIDAFNRLARQGNIYHLTELIAKKRAELGLSKLKTRKVAEER